MDNTASGLLPSCRVTTPLVPLAVRRPWTWNWFGHAIATWFVLVAGALPDERNSVPPGYQAAWHAIRPQLSLPVMLFSLAAALLLLFRRKFPLPVLAAATLLVIVSAVSGAFSAGPVVAVAIAVYTCVQHLNLRQGIWVVVMVALVIAAVSLPLVGWHTQHVLVIWVGAAMGEAVRSQRAQLMEARARADRAEATREAIARQRVAESRLAIARDLHDVVAHQIAVINLHAGVAANALPNRLDDAQNSLAIVQKSAKDVISDIGNLMTTLRQSDASTEPETSTGPEISTGPIGLAQLGDLISDFTGSGFPVTVRTIGQPRELPGAIDSAALRIIQEALTNAYKHGSELRAHVLIEYLPDTLSITITNRVPVSGNRPITASLPLIKPLAFGTGHGIIGMKERLESVHGTFNYGNDGNGKWVVTAHFPLPESQLPGSHFND